MSHTIEIPGGTAEFYDKDELTPRRQRPAQELGLQLGDLLERLRSAKSIVAGGRPDGDELPGLSGPPVEISDEQARKLTLFNDVIALMWLKSWTLEIPLPANTDALLDIPGPVYDAVTMHAAKLHVKSEESQFEPSEATLADPVSPTGDSGALETS